MIQDVRKNQMKGGRTMSSRNEKMLLIHGIVFLLFLHYPELILELGPFNNLGPNDKLITNQTCNTKKDLAFVVKFKAIREKFQIKLEKSSKSRYQERKCLKLRRLMTSIHVLHCLYKPNHRQANSKVLGTIIHDIMGQGSLSRYECFATNKYKLFTSIHTREFSLGLMMGTPEESFSKLPVYFHNLKKHNPGTVAYIKTDLEDCFEYYFFAIGCTKSYYYGWCPFDGKYKCTILHVVVMDGNNQILPIGYGICQKETTDSWTWFLEKLHECIGDVEGLTMVTDRAPAIAISIQNVFPNAQHGLCGFQLIGNIFHTFEKKIAILFWKLVRAYKTTEFEFYWGRLRNIIDDVATYLSQIPREKWTIAYCPTTRYDYMTSNSAESMNVVSNKSRKLPILPLLEFFRALMHKWFYKRRMAAEKV
uniref:MULE transposase domain-containing protein n=1 Tax=Lactuca sativa TaxID=4236 RepID=A0A9R1XH25_LACSA|nr:hypothetical protein LSAT_V11C400221740 [Lactuca sativa]